MVLTCVPKCQAENWSGQQQEQRTQSTIAKETSRAPGLLFLVSICHLIQLMKRSINIQKYNSYYILRNLFEISISYFQSSGAIFRSAANTQPSF